MSLKRWAGLATAAGIAWLVAAPPALAHTGAPPSPADLWTTWNWSLGLWAALGLTAWVYARGWLALEAHGQRPPGWQTLSFAVALAALFVALISPLDAAGSALLAAHMVQHVLLMLVAAPLLAVSRPLGPLLLGLPRRLGQAAGGAWRQAGWLRAGWQVLSHPATASLLLMAGLWGWHIPAAYQAALSNQWVHDAEHATFLGTALLFWWWALQPASRPSGNVAASFVAIFATGLQTTVLSLLLISAARPWYPAYTASAAAWGLTALQDQQMAGAIMWIISAGVCLLAIAGLLAGWLRQMDARDRLDQPEWLRAQERSWEQ